VTSDVVDVWLIRTDLPDAVLAGLELLLDDGERQRARALELAADRGRFVAAHGAARLIIGQRLGAPPPQLRWRHGRHGKPELAEPWTGAQVSLSSSGEFAALALTRHRRVGVDVQRILAGADVTAMSARFYPPAEARFVAAASGPAGQASRFVRLWTRKEACVKAAGGRLIPGLRLPALGADHGQVMAADPAGPLRAPCLVRDVPVPPGFYAAVALEGTLPYRVARHSWPAPWPAPRRPAEHATGRKERGGHIVRTSPAGHWRAPGRH
jgi:4'-phosphopantetheinyl transferase